MEKDLSVELIDPSEYGAAIVELRRAAETVARPLLDNGAELGWVRASIRGIVDQGVSDAAASSSRT